MRLRKYLHGQVDAGRRVIQENGTFFFYEMNRFLGDFHFFLFFDIHTKFDLRLEIAVVDRYGPSANPRDEPSPIQGCQIPVYGHLRNLKRLAQFRGGTSPSLPQMVQDFISSFRWKHKVKI
jgi:hypothetical protein